MKQFILLLTVLFLFSANNSSAQQYCSDSELEELGEMLCSVVSKGCDHLEKKDACITIGKEYWRRFTTQTRNINVLQLAFVIHDMCYIPREARKNVSDCYITAIRVGAGDLSTTIKKDLNLPLKKGIEETNTIKRIATIRKHLRKVQKYYSAKWGFDVK